MQWQRHGGVERQVVGSTLQSCKFFDFLGFLDIINGGGHIKTPASVNGINGGGYLKAPVLVNRLTEAGKTTGPFR